MTWTGVAQGLAAGAVGFAFVVACSDGGDGDGGATPIGQGGSGSGATSNGGSGNTGQGGTVLTGGSSSFGGSLSQGGTGGLDSDAACTSSRSQADAAVDIIWVVDSSCSMGDEIEKVRTNINNSFLSIIEGSNLAWNLIVVAAQGSGGLCVDSPPAGGNCADNPPRFHHLNCTVGSTNPLSVMSFTYNGFRFPAFPIAEPIFPCNANVKWRDWLRFQSTKVFVIVTDDEAAENPFDVDTWLTETADPAPFPGMFGTKADRKYIMNAIIGLDPANPGAACTSATNAAVEPGLNYQQLAALTGGTVASICEDDWSTIFNDVANTLVEGLGCEYQVPNPPPGETLDPARVNVSYTPGGGMEETVLQDDTAPCDGGADGWQWSPNMDKVVLCGATCDRVRSDPEGKVDVLFGCGTKVVPPK